jgi:hypothetical protein
MNFNNDELAALESGIHNIGVFFRLDVSPTVRIWLGFGDIKPGLNVLDGDGAVYRGFGAIQNVPSFRQMINGQAERVEFTLSGVDEDILRIASRDDAEQVKGKRTSVGYALMSNSWNLLGPVRWPANYYADFLSIRQAATGDPMQPIVRTISLSCGTLLTARRRPFYSFFSDIDQKARFAWDKFCERVSVYANGFIKTWPRF